MIRQLLYNKNYESIRTALRENPALANEEISLNDEHPGKAHPLHRIADGVFMQHYSDDEAILLAKIFLEYDANINGNKFKEKKDTPLIAAISLSADNLANFYMDQGADIHHAGTHGGTALHWACWCGRSKPAKRLLHEGAEINKRCIDFTATPLYWAVHGMKNGEFNNFDGHLECAALMVQAGADKMIPNINGWTVYDMLEENDEELRKIFG